MNLQIKKTNEINDVCSWFRYAEPEGGQRQWKEGRSAMEFARFMLSGNGKMPKLIQQYLNSIGCKDEVFTCYPEEVTNYDTKKFGSGTGRHHDGLLVSNNYLIGIEAKVSEPFDKEISIKLEDAMKNKDKGENMRKRIFSSLKMIKSDFNDESLGSVKSLMYQLVSGTVGTIIESQNRGKKNACFLIIEFVGDVDKEKDYNIKVENNGKAYEDFLKFLDLSNKSDEERFICKDDLKIWIKKIRITINKERYSHSKAE